MILLKRNKTEKSIYNMTLDELWSIARLYGGVDIFSHADGGVSAKITFQSIENTTLQAKSGFGHETPNAALIAAIQNARKILESFKP